MIFPSDITTLVAQELGIENITEKFCYNDTKPELKGLALPRKWPTLVQSQLSYEGDSLEGKKIILLDDLYQSGVTMQFVAMTLQQAGAYHIYGLSLAKNLSDSDNQ